jgi:predicted acylesterase/phospholipase RssA
MEIICHLCTNNIFNKINNSNISSLISGSGFYDFAKIQSELEKMTIKKIGILLTMEDLYKQFNKKLVVVTYNDTLQKSVYIDHKSHPNLACITAIQMSCSIPLLFNDFKYMGNHYIDGGFANNFPIDIPDEEEYTLGIHTYAGAVHICGENLSLFQRMNNMLMMLMNVKDSELGKNKRKNTEILNMKVNISENNAIVSMTTPYALELFSQGYKKCEKLLPHHISKQTIEPSSN